MAQTKQTIQIILINRSECSIVQVHLEQNNYIVVRVHESSSSESLWNGESLSRFCSIIVVFHLNLKFYAHEHFSCSNRYKKEYFLLLILDFKGIFVCLPCSHPRTDFLYLSIFMMFLSVGIPPHLAIAVA